MRAVDEPGGGRRSQVDRASPVISLLVGPAREMGLGETPRPWSFAIPEDVDRELILREACDATSVLHPSSPFKSP